MALVSKVIIVVLVMVVEDYGQGQKLSNRIVEEYHQGSEYYRD